MKGSRNLICRLQLMNSSKVGNIVKKGCSGQSGGGGGEVVMKTWRRKTRKKPLPYKIHAD